MVPVGGEIMAGAGGLAWTLPPCGGGAFGIEGCTLSK